VVERRKKVALLVPSSNTTMENDFHMALPKDRYTIHTDRMYLIETTREAEQMMLEKFAKPAASDLGTTNPDVIVFGCTSAGSLFGLDYDAKFCSDLGKIANCPSIGVINAASRALSLAKARKVAVITPYNDDLTASVAKALAGDGREIVAAHGMGITVNVELADPTPEEIVAFAREKLKGVTFDTLFVSCTNFRSLEAKPELEQVFGTKVITSNSAVIDAIEAMFSKQGSAPVSRAIS
jgi:maleate isomerase